MGRKKLGPISGTCQECGQTFFVSRRGNRKKKFCNEKCATTHNMKLRHATRYERRASIELCLTCHDKMMMKSEMSCELINETRRYILERRASNGFDTRKVSSMAARAFHASQGTLVTEEEKMRRWCDYAWSEEWGEAIDCYYAQEGYEYLRRGVNRRALWRKKYKVDPAFTCKRMLRNQIARIKRRTTWSKRSIEMLGCTYAEVRKWIESQFERGMTWANYGEWEIDHIIPIAAFDLTDERQVMCVNHYTNLRPLWAHENRSKRDRIERPHQLALL